MGSFTRAFSPGCHITGFQPAEAAGKPPLRSDTSHLRDGVFPQAGQFVESSLGCGIVLGVDSPKDSVDSRLGIRAAKKIQ